MPIINFHFLSLSTSRNSEENSWVAQPPDDCLSFEKHNYLPSHSNAAASCTFGNMPRHLLFAIFFFSLYIQWPGSKVVVSCTKVAAQVQRDANFECSYIYWYSLECCYMFARKARVCLYCIITFVSVLNEKKSLCMWQNVNFNFHLFLEVLAKYVKRKCIIDLGM